MDRAEPTRTSGMRNFVDFTQRFDEPFPDKVTDSVSGRKGAVGTVYGLPASPPTKENTAQYGKTTGQKYSWCEAARITEQAIRTTLLESAG